MILNYYYTTRVWEYPNGESEEEGEEFEYEVDWERALPIACKVIAKQYNITEKQAYDLITDLDVVDQALEYCYEEIKEYFEAEAFENLEN